MKICLKDEGRKRGGEEELTERGSGADGGLSSQIDSARTLYCSSTALLQVEATVISGPAGSSKAICTQPPPTYCSTDSSL